MNWLKNYLGDFPTHPATVFVALLLILVTGLIVAALLALQKEMPGGYDGWFTFLGAMAGITVAGGIGKRATDINYKLAGKGIVPPTPPVAAETPPS